MLVIGLDETFHKTYERGLLGSGPQIKKKTKLNIHDIFRTASPFSRVLIKTLLGKVSQNKIYKLLI